MLKKKLYLFYAVVGTAIFLLSLMTYLRFREKERAALFFAEIPDVILKDVEGKPTDLRSMFANRPTCIVYIDAGCRYCKDQIRDIEAKIDMLNGATIVFISPLSIDVAVDLKRQFSILSQEKAYFLLDADLTLYEKLRGVSTPFLVFYGTHGHFIASNNGFVKAEKIKKILLNK